MKKFIVCLFFVSLTACGIDNGTPSDGVIRHCSPGEILDPGHCNDACDQGTTHLVCDLSGTAGVCALKPGMSCGTTPPAPCAGDVRFDQIGQLCQPNGCPANSGTLFCNGSSVVCVSTSSCVAPINCYYDHDGDTVGGAQVQTFNDGFCPSGWVLIGGDCDDDDSTKQFVCSNDQVTCFRDMDRDGVATSVSQTFAQATCPSGWITNQGADCDDNDATRQYNCTTPTTWYRDADNDGFGCKLSVSASCQTTVSTTQPSGYVANSTDCNDAQYSASNTCGPVCAQPPTTDNESGGLCNDGIDNDCDGYIDGSDHGCAPVCLPLNGGTLRVELTQSVRNACTNGVIIVWGPGGVEHRSSAGAAYFQEYVGSNWQGYVHFNLLCNPTNPSLAGQAGYWSGTTHNWPSVGSDLSDYGVNISLNGTTLGQDQVIVNPEGSGTVKIGQGWLPGCTNQ